MMIGIISKLLTIGIFLASFGYIYAQGKSRKLPLLKQIFSCSILLAPYNAFLVVVSKLKPSPFVDIKEFDQLDTLTAYWPIIKKEAELLFEEGHICAAFDKSDICFDSFFKRGWKRFYISWFSQPLPSAVYSCPKTVSILNQIPCIKAALFARLPPRSRLSLHRMPFVGIMPYQLGLTTPNQPQCLASIDEESVSYKNGEAFVFDSLYTHEIINDTDKARLVLICYLERPIKDPFIKINHWIISFLGFITTPSNTEGEFIGITNRYYPFFSKFFGLVSHPLKLLKKHAKKAYKIVRSLLILLLIYVLYCWIGLNALFSF